MMKRMDLLSELRPVQRRLRVIRSGQFIWIGCLLGLLVGCVTLLIARLVPLIHYRSNALFFVIVGAAGGLIWSMWKRPTPLQAARQLDRHVHDDTVSTALAFVDDDGVLARLQREAAVREVQLLLPQLKTLFPLPIKRNGWLSLALFASLFVMLTLSPHPQDELIALKLEDQQWIEEQTEQVAELIERLKQEQDGNDEEQVAAIETMIDRLEQLQADLAASDQPQELLSAIEQQLQQLENIVSSKEGHEESLVTWAEFVQQHLAEMGTPLAGRLAERGLDVPESWREGGLAEQIAARNQLATADGVGDGASEVGVIGAGGGDGAGEGQGAGERAGGEGSGTGQGAGNGAGSGTGQGAGNGAGSGTGAGEGSGDEQGSGSGEGSGTGDGQGAGQGQGAGTGTGSRHLVYAPRTLTGEGQHHLDTGPIDSEGGDIIFGGQSPMEDGASRPYEEVFAQYADEAQQSLNRSALPHHVQHLVRNYFLEIQPER